MKKLYLNQMRNGIGFFALFALWSSLQIDIENVAVYNSNLYDFLEPTFTIFEMVILIYVIGLTAQYFRMLKEKREGEILFAFPVKKDSLWMNQWLAMTGIIVISWIVGVGIISSCTGAEVAKWVIPVILRDMIIFTIFMIFQTKIYGKVKAMLAWLFCMGLGMCTVFHIFQWMGMVVPLRKYNLYGYFVQGIATIFSHSFMDLDKISMVNPVWKWAGENQYMLYGGFVIAAAVILLLLVRLGRRLWMQQESQVMNHAFKPVSVGIVVFMIVFCIGMSYATMDEMLIAWDHQLMLGYAGEAICYIAEYPAGFQKLNVAGWLLMILSMQAGITAARWQEKKVMRDEDEKFMES